MGQFSSKKQESSNQSQTPLSQSNGQSTSTESTPSTSPPIKYPEIIKLKRMDSNATQDDMEGLINSDITLPKHTPFTITWELVKKIRIENRFELFHRSPSMQEIYMKSVEKNKEIYFDYESKLLNELFDIPLFKDAKTGKLKADKSKLKKIGKKMKFTENAFPYNFEKGIKHDLLWCTKALTLKEIKNAINKNIANDRKVIWWVNPMKYRSVPGLYHAQILSYKPE